MKTRDRHVWADRKLETFPWREKSSLPETALRELLIYCVRWHILSQWLINNSLWEMRGESCSNVCVRTTFSFLQSLLRNYKRPTAKIFNPQKWEIKWHSEILFPSTDNTAQHFCFLIKRSWVQIYVPKPTILSQVYNGFPPSVQATAGIETQIWSFLIHYSLIILSVHAIQNAYFVRQIAFINSLRYSAAHVDDRLSELRWYDRWADRKLK